MQLKRHKQNKQIKYEDFTTINLQKRTDIHKERLVLHFIGKKLGKQL